MSAEEPKRFPEQGEAWPALRERLVGLGADDIDWRNKKSAVYVFHPGEDVLEVAKEAYALYQSENALGPAAFPSLKRMESEVVSMALDLLNGPADGTGNITSGGTESILLAVKSCRDEAASRGVDVIGANLVLPRTAHLAFDKAAHYLGLEIRRVDVDGDFLADPAAIGAAMDERTILIMGSAPCFPYGLGDPRLALIAFGPEDGDELNIFAVWKSLHDRGWFSGVVANPNGIHMMLSPSHEEVADEYLRDLGEAVAEARGGAANGPNPPVRYA